MMAATSGAPPEKQRGGSPAITPGNRPNAEAPPSNTSTSIVAKPTAVATAYRPDRGRSRWLMIVEICPLCGEAHQHYAKSAARPAKRTSGCGHLYMVFPVFGGSSTVGDAAVKP